MGVQNGAASSREYLRTVYREGCAHQAGGRHADAAAAFAAAVALAPDFADAAQNLGCSLHALARFAEAAAACATAVRLRPDASGYFNLGMALLSDGQPAQAIEPLLRCVSLAPEQVRHHRTLARALEEAGRKPDAAAALLAAAERHGSDAGLVVHLAGLLCALGRTEPAAEAALLATQLAPDNAAAHGYLASALQRLGRSRAALPPARAALRLNPAHAPAAVVLSAVLFSLGHYAEALDAARHAAHLAPGLADAKANEALALEGLGRLDEAEAAGRAALRLNPDGVEARYNLASLLLTSGTLTAEAWSLYDARFGLNDAARQVARFRRWRGEDVTGQTLLLHCEQGLGDTIQFARYAPLVARRCGRVILVVQTALVRLLTGLPGVDAVHDAAAPLPPYDVFCPLLSLPGILGTTLDTIPPSLPLPVPAAAPSRRDGLQIGLAWAGSTGFTHDTARSIPLSTLAPLASVPGVTFHSLQWPQQTLAGFPAIDAMAAVTDMADTAAIIAGLDLVICVDTAVAHLAATMGKPVWLLSRYNGCWRWLRDRDDSPWYPTMRIYRQARPNDWTAVITRIRADLARHALGQPPSAAPPLDGPARLPTPAKPTTVLAFVNGSGPPAGVADGLTSRGLHLHTIDLATPDWPVALDAHLQRGVLFAYGPAGTGARMLHPEGGLVWDRMHIPYVSVHTAPVRTPAEHCVRSRWVANGYLSPDGLDLQRRLIRAPQLCATIRPGIPFNPARNTIASADRPHRMLLLHSGRDPAAHRAEWATLPPRLHAILADAASAATQAGPTELTALVLRCAEAHGLCLARRTDVLFGLAHALDSFLLDHRATVLVQALRGLPVDVAGDGWDHVAGQGGPARFHPPPNASALPPLLADTRTLLNVTYNASTGLDPHVLTAFAAGTCVITDENPHMRTAFAALPSYHPIDIADPALPDQLAALFHASPADTGPAAALAAEYSPAAHMHDIIELALAVAGTAQFAPFAPGGDNWP